MGHRAYHLLLEEVAWSSEKEKKKQKEKQVTKEKSDPSLSQRKIPC